MIRISELSLPSYIRVINLDYYSEFDDDTDINTNFSEEYINMEEKDTFWKCMQYILEKTFCCVTK